MGDALLVRRLERLRHLLRDREVIVNRQSALGCPAGGGRTVGKVEHKRDDGVALFQARKSVRCSDGSARRGPVFRA